MIRTVAKSSIVPQRPRLRESLEKIRIRIISVQNANYG